MNERIATWRERKSLDARREDGGVEGWVGGW
jgi:hypothetical protein